MFFGVFFRNAQRSPRKTQKPSVKHTFLQQTDMQELNCHSLALGETWKDGKLRHMDHFAGYFQTSIFSSDLRTISMHWNRQHLCMKLSTIHGHTNYGLGKMFIGIFEKVTSTFTHKLIMPYIRNKYVVTTWLPAALMSSGHQQRLTTIWRQSLTNNEVGIMEIVVVRWQVYHISYPKQGCWRLQGL